MPYTNDYYKKREDPYKPRLRGGVRGPLTFFLILFAIIFIMSVFFRVARIDVQGNSQYSDEEIISASGIDKGDSLFFVNSIAAGSRITVKLPYVDAVQIDRSLPNRVVIKVIESEAVGCVTVGDELWSVSADGKFLSTITRDDSQNLATISGITAQSAAVGEYMTVPESDSAKLEYLKEILYQIKARQLTGKVTAIDMSDVSDPTFEYDGRFTVKLGAHDDTEYKFGKMLSAVSQLTQDDAGTLDVSTGDKVVFNPN